MIVPPGTDDLIGRGHSLHGLVEVLVERITGTGRDNDVERSVDGPHRGCAGAGACGCVFSIEVAAVRVHDGLVLVEHHVQPERDPGGGRDRAHVVVHRIAFDDAPARVRVPDPGRVV